MEPKLIYHTPESSQNGVSPFDAAIVEMVGGHDVSIVCPYLGLRCLHRIIEAADRWKLVTDISEWLASHSVESRAKIVDFIIEHNGQIHHCQDLHAKVLIAGNEALVGSANFTEKGITGRVEMSVRFEGGEHVEELKAWFDLLWSETASVNLNDLRACAAGLPEPMVGTGSFVLPNAHAGVHAIFGGQKPQNEIAASDAEERLIDRLRMAPNRQWMESWLDLAKSLLEATGLGNDDPRLAMTLPTDMILPISINSRYVLTAFRGAATQQPGVQFVELILPRHLESTLATRPGAVGYAAFGKNFRGETDLNIPLLVRFDPAADFKFSPDLLSSWHEACIAECGHQRKSSYRKYHEPAVYRVVMDAEYRSWILDRAFKDE